MEAAFLGSVLAKMFVKKFTAFAERKIASILGVKEKLKKLERTILKVQAWMDDLDNHQPSSHASVICHENLKEVFNDTEFLLDSISLELDKCDDSKQRNPNQVRDMIFKSFKFNIPSAIDNLQNRFDILVEEIKRCLLIPSKVVLDRQYSTSLVDKTSIVGRDKDREDIVRQLLNGIKEEKSPSVISIVGMGGIGKTTLTQLVYNEDEIVNNFDLRVWVSVSVQDDFVRIIKSIIECAKQKCVDVIDLNLIQIELQRTLADKKVLLVLDNMWNENPIDWEILQIPFKVAEKGSKILVTTRSQIVSSAAAGSCFTYHMTTLPDEDCWKLIKHIVFQSNNQEILQDVVKIGAEIAKKCKGLPLAAKMIGNILRSKSREMKCWEDMLKLDIWDMTESKNEIYSSLKVSYEHLSTCLKRCFVYCSIFPYNYEFNKDELVQLWVAEGFIQEQKNRFIEDVGGDYFDELLWKSFFEPSSNRSYYTMHALLNDLAELVSGDLCHRVEDNMSLLLPKSTSVLHLSFRSQQIPTSDLEMLLGYRRLRTFISTSPHFKQIADAFFEKVECLRVLVLSSSEITILPKSINSVKLLRYLDVSRTDIQMLPDSVASLYALETLKLNDCPNLRGFPKDLKNLSKLRCLEFAGKNKVKSMPSEFGKLTNLESLHPFVYVEVDGQSIAELKNMNRLRGSLKIIKLENVVDSGEAKAAMLDKKEYLNSLDLEWTEYDKTVVVQRNDEAVLGGLIPHNGLRELVISNYLGKRFPVWLGAQSFDKLEMICLINSQDCTEIPALGQLPNLKSLYISRMHDLQGVDKTFCAQVVVSFPRLEILKFVKMKNLQTWSGIENNDMPNLRQLDIRECPKLETLPPLHYLTSLNILKLYDCPMLQSLPDEGLPSSLHDLSITGCGLLKLQRDGEEGEDWKKIKFVDQVMIEGDQVPTKMSL